MNLKFFFCVFVPAAAYQYQYYIVMEKVEIEYIDNNLMDFKYDLVEINKTVKALNFIFLSKVDIPDTVMITAEAFKLVGTKYSLPVVQIRRPLKDIMQMESFDLQTLWSRICRPPMVWPIEKNVVYRMNNWIPNSTVFPPNAPSGKFRGRLTQSFANKTKVVVYVGHGRVVYFKSIRKLKP